MSSKAKPFEDIEPDEYLENPIWEMALSNSDITSGWDETWRKPVVGATNLEEKSVGYFLGLRVEGTSLIANALFYSSSGAGTSNDDWIGQVFIWQNDRWVDPLRIPEGILTYPLIFEAIPTVRNVGGVKFAMEEEYKESAYRIA